MQNYVGLAVFGGIAGVATLVLLAVAVQMRQAGTPLRPVVFLGVFFGLILIPGMIAAGARVWWPKAEARVDADAAVRDARPGFVRLFDSPWVQAASVVGLMLIASLWFFRGSSWAARIEGQGSPEEGRVIAERLRGIAGVEGQGRHFELAAAIVGIGREERHRIVMDLDEARGRVRVTEFVAGRDTPSGAANWDHSAGIVLFQTGAQGNLQDRRQALIETVTAAGWDWQPVVWNTPAALAWLLE